MKTCTSVRSPFEGQTHTREREESNLAVDETANPQIKTRERKKRKKNDLWFKQPSGRYNQKQLFAWHRSVARNPRTLQGFKM